MAEYKTEQRKQLLDFMQKNSGLALSVDEWTIRMQQHQSDAPGRSTVYRTLLMLEKQGLVIRTKERRHSRYQIAGCSHDHLHLKCLGCGKLVHLSHSASHALEQIISKDEEFSVDGKQTVIYGTCSDCK